jgi:hypothetical protein
VQAGPQSRWSGIFTVAGIIAFVAVVAQLPLIRNRIFYYWDDSAAAFLPHWFRIGELLRQGNWPTLMPESWMGGNYASEAMLGLWNPVSLGNYVIVSLLPDVAVAATFVKVEFLVLLAVGVYFLAREYGANRGAAAVVATALPFSGYTLFFDASAWVAGLMAFAWLPWVWWAARRFATGKSNPIWLLVFGYLAMTVGNPYGALGVVFILLGVALELAVRKNWRKLGHLVVTGGLVGASSLVVFFPLLGSAAVTWRTDNSIRNDGFLVPNLADLIGMSAPTYQAQFNTWTGSWISFPITYLAWFVVPLVPWLAWSVLRDRWRDYLGLYVFAAIYVLLLIGPSNLWLFRWPARLLEYVYLPLSVVVAVLLTKGFQTSAWRVRMVLTAVLVALGAYLSIASTPTGWRWHALATVLVVVLLAALLYVARSRPKLVALTLVLGTAATLGLQVAHYRGNLNVNPWNFPHNVAEMKKNFDERYQGNTLLVADLGALEKNSGGMSPETSWKYALFGSQWEIAGVEALNSYTGLGYSAFSETFCMNYFGGTCPAAYNALWKDAGSFDVPLADAVRLQTVVVANGYVKENGPERVPAGWSVQERNSVVTVLKRDAPLPYQGSRLSYVSPGVQVSSAASTGFEGERLTYRGSGKVLFAALAWPGWTATVDGKEVKVEQGPAGLIQLDLPASSGESTVDLAFSPPGLGFGWKLLIGSLVLGLLHALYLAFASRRRSRVSASE